MRSLCAVVTAAALVAAVTAVPAAAQPAAGAEIRPELAAAASTANGKPVPAIVVLDKAADLSTVYGDHDAVVAELKRVAAQTQPAVRAAMPAGVTVRASLWLTNALVVELPATGTTTALTALSRVPGVAELALNPQVHATDPRVAAGPVTTIGAHTWGIDRVRADRVWDELGVTGTGVRVAVRDTGVDARHPDIAGRVATDDPADPSHPGGWIAFDTYGTPYRSAPNDDDGHGTHVSGTVVGGAASGTAIGVAPGAKLMLGQVLPDGEGSWAQVLAGMQWSIAPYDWQGNPAGAPADVVNMSVGVRGYLPETVPVTRAIRASGAFPAFSIGHECEPGVTSSPANTYDANGVGATDPAEAVPWWSCGGVVSKKDWAGAPADWPASFPKPDISAPGLDVLSAVPGGGYGLNSGTSMATPHVAGTVALMRSAVPGLSVDDAAAALRDTAVFTGTERPDARSGAGRIDAFDAVRAVAGASGVSGRVTDAATRAPVAHATVTDQATGRSTTTGADGRYRMPAAAGAHTLAVAAPTYATATVRTTVPADGTATADVRLTGTPAGTLTGAVTYGGRGVPGATVTVSGGSTTTTGADGRYTVDRLAPGEHQVRAAAAGLPVSGTGPAPVTAGRSATVDVAMTPPAAVARASVTNAGAEADSYSSGAAMTADARYVAFDSYAGNVVDGDTNGQQDVFVRDREAGTTELVSLGNGGVAGDGMSLNPSLSADAQYVAFESYAANFAEGDTAFSGDVFLRDRQAGTTVRLSQAPDGTQANGMSGEPAVSADGRFVAFQSYASNLVPGDTNGASDVFVYDVAARTLERVSVGDDESQGGGGAQTPDISGDGRYVVFASTAANLVAGDANGWRDVFVRDRVSGSTTLVSVASDGTQGNHEPQDPTISDDGNVVVFSGYMSNLVPGDTNATYDVFAHDRRTAATSRVSVNSSGAQSTGTSIDGSVSADGRHVAFSSAGTNLADGDVNGAMDVFVRDLATGETTLVSAPAGGGADRASYDPLVSADGGTVVFVSEATNLVPGDTNWTGDVFVVDRFPPIEQKARFALSGLTVSPAVAPRGGTVTVSARVTNIGAAAGDHEAALSLDGTAEPTRPVSLRPGASQVVTWSVSAEALGGHDVRVGSLTGSFRVRAPLVRVTASTVDDTDPLRGATVRLVEGGTPRPGGVTAANGAVSVEPQTADREYTVVVTRAATRHDPAYLLVKRLRVDRDTTVALSPRLRARGGDPVAELDLRLDELGGEHQAWTYLRPASTAPTGFAFAPGKVVASTGAYELRQVHRIGGFERDWWAVSDVQEADFGKQTYRRTFGGRAHASVTGSYASGTVTTTWSVTDAHRNPFAVMAHTPLRDTVPAAVPPPATAAIGDLPKVVLARAPQQEELVLRLYDGAGAVLHAGGVGWSQREVTREVGALPAGTYRVQLTAATGGYSPGELVTETRFTVS